MSLNSKVKVEEEEVDLAAEVFTLLADPTRIRIILLLRATERSSGELAELTGRSSAGGVS